MVGGSAEIPKTLIVPVHLVPYNFQRKGWMCIGDPKTLSTLQGFQSEIGHIQYTSYINYGNICIG